MSRRVGPASGLVLGAAVGVVAVCPVHAEEAAVDGAEGQAADGATVDRAERIEELREAIRREQAELADDRARRRAVRDRLESVRDDLEDKREELRALEETAQERADDAED